MDKCANIIDSYLQPVLDIWSEKQEQTVCPISGNCMSPLIREGDLLVIKHGNQDIHTGDVAVYGEPGEFYVHRVIRIQTRNGKNSCFFKPDRYFSVKQNIAAEKIIGKVIEVQGTNGHFNFNSLFWKCVNPLLAIFFYTCWRSFNRDTVYWKAYNTLIIIWQKISPMRYSISLNLLRVIYHTNKIWFRMRPFNSAKK